MGHSSPDQAAVVITGCSTGIGAACARELARRGFRVFAGVRSESDFRRLAAEGSAGLVPLRLDVTKGDQIEAAARQVEQSLGSARLAGLVNNAGTVVAGPLELLPIGELRRQWEVNVIGQVAVTQAFLPILRRSGGRIVNMGSFNGRIAPPYMGPYAASKFALEAISDCLRTELRHWNIHVALIEPGSIATPIWEKTLAAADALRSAIRPEALALYEADVEAMRAASRLMAQAALPVATVVRAVVHALTARRPKCRYPIGLQTRLLFRAIKWVPDPLWDRIVQRWLRLPRHRP
ncbi:MAG: SDR family oxidoreductase [Thermoguttaceae bacterium]